MQTALAYRSEDIDAVLLHSAPDKIPCTRKPVSESVMEVRMHPRSDSNQRCLTFPLSVSPRCRVFSYRDHLSNNVHHFDIPGQHEQLVDHGRGAGRACSRSPRFRIFSLLTHGASSMRSCREGDYWEMLLPSEFAKPTPALEELARELGRRTAATIPDAAARAEQRLYDYFDYVAAHHACGFAHR